MRPPPLSEGLLVGSGWVWGVIPISGIPTEKQPVLMQQLAKDMEVEGEHLRKLKREGTCRRVMEWKLSKYSIYMYQTFKT